MGMGRPRGECVFAIFGAAVNDQIDGAFETGAVDDDLDLVAFAHFADGAAGQGFRSDVADAGATGDATKTRVGEDGDFLSEVEVAKRGGDFEDLLHTGTHGAAAHQNNDVAGVDVAVLDSGDGGLLGDEDARGAGLAVDAVGRNNGGIDGRALDDGAAWGEVAGGKGDGGSEPARAGAIRVHDDVIGIDAVIFEQNAAQGSAAFGLLPPIENGVELFSGDGEDAGLEQAGAAQMQHDFGHASGQKDLHGGMHLRAVGKGIDQAGDLAVDARPVIHCGAAQAGGVGDGGDVENQVGGSAEGR